MFVTLQNAKEIFGSSLLNDLIEVLYDSSIYERYTDNIVSSLKGLGENDLAKRVEARCVEWSCLEAVGGKQGQPETADVSE